METTVWFLGVLIVLISQLVKYTTAVTITCPRLSCSVELDSDVWFLHDNLQPTVLMKGQSCSNKRICEFSPSNGEFLWYSESSQHSAGTKINNREIQANCIPLDATKQNLYGGRNCELDFNCYSGTWDDGVCTGLLESEYCAIDADCGPNLFWKKESKWPYRAKCNTLLGNMEICTSDYHCEARFFCWYATEAEKVSGVKRCLAKYSADDDQVFGWSTASSGGTLTDQEHNGQFCQSGLAVTTTARPNLAICKSVTSVTFNGSAISSPYRWTPTDNAVKCRLVYGTGATDFVETPCVWALDGTNAYWGSVVGTLEYKRYSAAMKVVLEGSKCHTLDRDNFRAQKEGCGIGTSNDQWRFAVQKRFNVTYWPWMQDTTTRNCIEAIFKDSYTNMVKDDAVFLHFTLTTGMLTILSLLFN